MMEHLLETLNKVLDDVHSLASEGYGTDGAHHKQWYLGQILKTIGRPVPDELVDGETIP